MKKNTKNKKSVKVPTVDNVLKMNTSTRNALLIGGNTLAYHYMENHFNDKFPFKKENGLYVRVLKNDKDRKGLIFLNRKQAREINNLLNAKMAINEEIKKIKKSK
jgi:hypothetical protein